MPPPPASAPSTRRAMAVEMMAFLSDALDGVTSIVGALVIVLTMMILMAADNAIALWLLGVPAALLWGIVAFVCSFIPNAGCFLALIPPVIFGLSEQRLADRGGGARDLRR